MRLLLDIGNTRLKWQLDSGHVLTSAEALAHDGQPAQAIAALAPRLAGQRIEQTCVAHVMGAAHEAAVSTEVQRLCREAPRYARCLAEFDGLRIAYAEPARLGVDRWLMLLAQWHAHRAAGAVASAGTALTYDAVDDTGQHLGGVIAPGLSVMMDATLGRTRFAAGEIVPEFSAGLGQNTEACVRQGALHAAAGLLDRLGTARAGPRWLAGGDAHTLLPHLTSGWHVKADLVLCGLSVWSRLYSAA